MSPVGEVSKAVRDAAVETMKDMGIDVSMDAEEGQRVLDMVNGGEARKMTAAESERRKKREETNRSIDEATAYVTGKDVKKVRKERIEREEKRRRDAQEVYGIILSGEYNDVSLQKIEEYINDVTPNNPYGRRLSERLPQKVERRMYERERSCAIDALFTRVSESAVRPNERVGASGKRAVADKKRELLEQWAKATGNWHTDLKDFTEQTEAVSDDTTDSDVYLSNDKEHVIKLSRGKQGKRFGSDVDSVPLFNYVFPNSAYKIIGYGDFGKGFVRILEQPIVDFANSTPLTEAERVEYMASLGFKPIGKGNTAFSNGEIVVADLQGNNIVRDAAGNIRVIDADCKLHTKDVGGEYEYLPVEHDLPTDLRQMKAFHGSGADFDAFDHSHMGEGEGAQSYGWGTYVTEVEGIGRTYAEQDNRKDKAYRAARFARSAYDRTVWDMQHASTKEEKVALREKAKAQKEKYDKKLQEWRDMEDNHFLYTVEIPDDNGRNYLRWDKVVANEIIDRLIEVLEDKYGEDVVWNANLKYGQTAQQLYTKLSSALGGDRAASEFLHRAGYTGIKYPTNYSVDRSDKGTYNYVIFDEGDLKITDKAKFFRTQDGVAYGFTLGGKVYIDPRIATSETPVHEYMHLWAQGVRRTNPKAWEDIKRAFAADADLVDWVRRRYPEIEDEDTLMEEVFAHYSGRRGAERLEADMKAAMDAEPSLTMKARVATVFHKLRELLNRFWGVARDMFAGKDVDLRKMSREDIADMAVGDLLGGFNPNSAGAKAPATEQMLRMQNDAERAAIVERAKADGTYMKAPNGMPTKLSERQWVEVRTKAFKEWFGDWEKAARIEKLKKSESVEITGREVTPSEDLKEYRKNAEQYAKTLRGKYRNEDTGVEIELTSSRKNGGIREILEHDYKDAAHLQSVAAIPQIIEKSIYVESQPNEDTKVDAKQFDYYVCGLKIGAQDYTVKSVIVTLDDGTRYYDHKLTSIEKGKLIDLINGRTGLPSNPISSESSDNPVLNNNVKDKRLLSILENNSSKIVDENGEPLVVYHGTKKGGFSKFKDGYIYLADQDTAQSYATYYDDWTDAPIIRNYGDEYDGDGRSLYTVFLNVRNPLTYDYQNTGALDGYDGLESPSYYTENMPNVNDGLVLLNIKDLSEFMGGAAEFDEDGQPIEDYSDHTVYVVRYPNQIKSATDNVGTYDGGNADIRFQEAGDVFYSNAEKAVEGVKQEKATAEQWKAMVTKAGGLKAGEDKWLGLGDWLEERKWQTRTKQEVLDYIRENKVQVEEVEYSESDDQALFADYKREYKRYYDEAVAEGAENAQEEAWQRMIDEHGDDFGLGFYAVGDELQWDDWGDNSYLDYERENGQGTKPINETRLRYTTAGLENKKEIALTVPTVEPWNEDDKVHFGDAGGGRAVCWVRFGEARDKDGKRVLVIDEIQSKRHQEGREKGYNDPQKRREYTSLVILRARELGVNPRDFVFNDEYKEERAKLQQQVYGRVFEPNEKGSDVPDAPFEKNWHEVAMKRMMRYAAENGFDKVAWTTGEQQAERYNIGQSVKSIEKEDDYSFRVNRPDGGYMTLDFDEDGVYRDEADADLNGKTMADVFGKELASRLQGAEVGSTVEGEGLRIGGEGMKGFYDRMLPQFMDKYGKKWGVKSGEVELELPNEADRVMHSVDVTEEMKRSVMEGQPMFQKVSMKDIDDYDKENGTELRRFADFLGRGRKLNEGESRYFHIGNTGDLLNRYGITGKITIGTSAMNGHHSRRSFEWRRVGECNSEHQQPYSHNAIW